MLINVSSVNRYKQNLIQGIFELQIIQHSKTFKS